MEQRPLRLGDLVDDYCPRERRVTNHAIVAIVNDSIRQTRCTACDTEHVFKGGKPPRRRAKDTGEQPVDNTGGQLVTPSRADEDASVPTPAAPTEIPAQEVIVPMSAEGAGEPAAAASPEAAPEPEQETIDDRPDVAWPANRQLIRATLPRTEGDVPPPRPIPEFTMHQRYSGRGAGAFRQARAWADQGFGSARGGNPNPNGNGNANGNGSRDRRPGQGQGPGFGPGPGQGRRRHGKRRPR